MHINESLLKKSKQIEELKIWYKDMTSYPNIYNNKNFSNVGNLINNLEVVNESDLLSKLIETSASKDKPVIVHNSQKKVIGVISQADLLKAVIEGVDGE